MAKAGTLSGIHNYGAVNKWSVKLELRTNASFEWGITSYSILQKNALMMTR